MFFLVTVISKMLLRFFDNLFSDLVSTLFISWAGFLLSSVYSGLITNRGKKYLLSSRHPW